MEPEVRILKEQQKFKKKMIEKMEKQNKRYKEALELIESLIKDNEKLKFESNSTKKPKRPIHKSCRKPNLRQIANVRMFRPLSHGANGLFSEIN